MEKYIININQFNGNSISLHWEDNYSIKVLIANNGKTVEIISNKEGLISLAHQFISLAQDNVPNRFHYHLDKTTALENDSVELIIEKNNNL